MSASLIDWARIRKLIRDSLAGQGAIQGQQGPQGPQGDPGPQGVQGPQGERGPEGPEGPRGPQGETGQNGSDGTSFAPTGLVDTPQDLPVMAWVGMSFFVGTAEPYHIWSFISTDSQPQGEWVDVGQLEGPQGSIGPEGPTGPQGSQGVQGPQGPQGIQGPVGDMLNVSPEMHSMVFRGKNLGDTVTDSQKEAIQNGSFDDLYVGDYWVINSITWRIVDINYWLNCGDVAFTSNHLVIMPDDQLYTSQMNTSNITTGGYIGSVMRTTNIDQAKTIANSAFGTMIKKKRSHFENAVTNGKASGGAWYDSDVDLPNEINMYGGFIYRPMNDGITSPNNYTADKSQFSLFAISPKFIIASSGQIRHSIWLRDPVSATYFAIVSASNLVSSATASSAHGVRPCFAIG